MMSIYITIYLYHYYLGAEKKTEACAFKNMLLLAQWVREEIYMWMGEEKKEEGTKI